MSDSTFNDDSQVDPRLDALLSRTLGRGSVPRQQRQRHLERLGITPRLGGSAGTWRAPVVAGRPPSSATPQPESLPTRRRRRQWLELGAAVLAIVLVGGLLVALFRDWNGEDDQQLAASPEATTAPATATPRETREQLYVVSHAMRLAQDVVIPEGRVSAIDPETGEEFWSVEAGPRIDAVLSPDGQRLFVADSQREGDFVYALDTQTGRELWRQPIENRQWMKPATGQSMLSVSPDGSTLSVYTCEGCTGEIRSNTGRNWLARFNALTGNRHDDLEITACRGTTILGPESAASRPLYVICDTTSRLEIVDLATGQPLMLTYDERLEGGFPETTGINASVVSPDGRFLYLASGNRLTFIDMTRHAATRVQLLEEINVERRLPLLALSPDGERLYIGSLDTAAYDRGRAEVNRVDVYDTATWEPLGQIATSYPMNGQAFTTAPDGDAVFGTFVSYPGTDDNAVESRILRHTLDGEPVTVATRTNEEVLYLFAGTVEVNPDAEPLPTSTPEPTAHERLFAVAHTLTPTGDAVASGQVTAYDAETGEIVYRIETGTNPDAILSPDGRRLYIAAISEDGDTLSSFDTLSGDRNWSVPIQSRVTWHDGTGPTRLAVSQDGGRLFVYSASAPGDYTIQVFDTADGRLGRVIDGVAGCTAQLFPSADGRSLYVVCLAERFAPQVIDLEAWTSAGVMQGFGGIITGAAASPDGRYLYIPHDIDTELRLTVVDMNGRTISTQRDIVHMASDPLHMLNITAVSPDGSRLFIGLGKEPEGEAGVADQVWVWDTANLHHDSQKLRAPEPINSWSLAPGPDNQSVFAIHNVDGPDAGGQPSLESIVIRLGIEGGSDEFVRHWGGDVLRVFSGRVTGSTVPPPPDTSEARLIDELAIPEHLPRGLTLSSASSGADTAELTFTGDDARVVQIDVERWDSQPLDPPVRSTQINLGNLSAYVIPDPEGGWPRGVYWHDSRFVYSLSVLSSPAEGWTQDDAIAVVLAFSSPADPAATWDILRSRPLHETGMVPTPPCLRTAPQQVFDDFGPVVGDMQINGGPVYLNGPDENGAISLAGAASEDGGYYQRVMFVVGGDYTGPMLVRPSPGSGPIGFTNAAPDPSPAGEWHLTDPAGTSPTPGVRHWIVYLRFDGPGCHALQIDGLDFSSIIVFEVVAEGGV